MLKLAKFLKPFTGYILLIIMFMFFQGLTELYLPTLMADIVDKGMLTGDTRNILSYGSYMLATALVSILCAVLGAYVTALTAIGFGKDLRLAVFERAEFFSINDFDKFGAASLITRTTNDIMQVQNSLIMIFRFMFYTPVMCIGGLIMAFSRDRGLTQVIALAIPVLIFILMVAGKVAVPLYKQMQKMIDKLNLVVRENLTGIRVIRAFNKADYEKRRFNEANADLMHNAIKVNRIMAAIFPLVMFIMNTTQLAVIWFGGVRISAGMTTVGDMMAFLQYAMIILFSFVMVAMVFTMLPRAQASAERINEVLDSSYEITDTKNPVFPSKTKGVIEFKSVTFRYKGAPVSAVNNISFKAEPGKTTAIIGGTGSGKSTIVNLIPRFYDLESGEILLDGINIKSLTQKTLRQKIGFVPQKAILFSDTVRGNIGYGSNGAPLEDIVHAAKVAQASDFINNMDNQYESLISQGGTNVSGGQRQRLSIARALARKPFIYIFDDSFSALDFKTDAKLRAALEQETADKTVIIVAQRVSTIMGADTIIALDNGKIAGMGTHDELMQSCGVYKEIVMSQIS